jgi:hypothetical protein
MDLRTWNIRTESTTILPDKQNRNIRLKSTDVWILELEYKDKTSSCASGSQDLEHKATIYRQQ